MPYKYEIEKKKIPPELDRRRKLPESEHRYIRERQRGGESMRALAREYAVSRRLIAYICFPERLEVDRKSYKERRKDGRYYPEKGKWAQQMRKHRHYKQSIKERLQ